MAYLEESYLLGVHWVNYDTYTQRIAHLQGVILQFEAKFNVPVQQLHTVQVTVDEVLEYCAAKLELRDLQTQLDKAKLREIFIPETFARLDIFALRGTVRMVFLIDM